MKDTTIISPGTGREAYVHYMAGPVERTDAQVVRDVLSGDRDAYRLLVRRYGDVLYGHALRMVGTPDDASDLVQKAFVKGFRKLASCQDTDRVGAWLFRILSNLSKDHLRSPRRSDVPLESLPEPSDRNANPLEALHREEIRQRLQMALGKLTAEQREAFALKHLEGRSYEEMAAVLDVSVGSLKMRVKRAREALKDLLEEYR